MTDFLSLHEGRQEFRPKNPDLTAKDWLDNPYRRCRFARSLVPLAETTNLITTASLKSSTVKDLSELAKSHGLSGWHSMKKDELIRRLLKLTRKPASKPATTAAKKARAAAASAKARQQARIAGKKSTPVRRVSAAKTEQIARKIHAAHEKREKMKDLSAPHKNGAKADKDRIVLMVRDPYWLHVCWHVARTTVMRAQAAMAEHWHTARPVLRLLEVDAGPTTSTAEKIVREIEVHGGVQNWYVEAPNPPHSYRIELGYRSAAGKFFTIARSNMVTTPAPGSSDSIDENWNAVAQDYEKVYALSGGYSEERSSGELQELFEERLRRPMGPASAKYGVGAERLLNRHKNFQFAVEAEMIIYGATSTDARVTLGGEPVKLRSDGTFTVRMAMPDKRQVIPAVAASADGVEQRTIVLAVERNTKVLEPMHKEQAVD
jgi:hypothetical protein